MLPHVDPKHRRADLLIKNLTAESRMLNENWGVSKEASPHVDGSGLPSSKEFLPRGCRDAERVSISDSREHTNFLEVSCASVLRMQDGMFRWSPYGRPPEVLAHSLLFLVIRGLCPLPHNAQSSTSATLFTVVWCVASPPSPSRSLLSPFRLPDSLAFLLLIASRDQRTFRDTGKAPSCCRRGVTDRLRCVGRTDSFGP